MRQKSTSTKDAAEKTVRDIRRKTRKQYSAEEKIRIVLEGLRGEDSTSGPGRVWNRIPDDVRDRIKFPAEIALDYIRPQNHVVCYACIWVANCVWIT